MSASSRFIAIRGMLTIMCNQIWKLANITDQHWPISWDWPLHDKIFYIRKCCSNALSWMNTYLWSMLVKHSLVDSRVFHVSFQFHLDMRYQSPMRRGKNWCQSGEHAEGISAELILSSLHNRNSRTDIPENSTRVIQ